MRREQVGTDFAQRRRELRQGRSRELRVAREYPIQALLIEREQNDPFRRHGRLGRPAVDGCTEVARRRGEGLGQQRRSLRDWGGRRRGQGGEHETI